jgi:hypothetical protein
MTAKDSEDTELAQLQGIVREVVSEDNLGAREIVLNAWETLLKKRASMAGFFRWYRFRFAMPSLARGLRILSAEGAGCSRT